VQLMSPKESSTPVEANPIYDALELTKGGTLANIILDDQTYTLRVTRAGKLILTK
jgi:hemin uptake protein HemP